MMVSFPLVPVLAPRWLSAHGEEGDQRGFAGAWERGFDRLGRGYRWLLSWAIHHRPLIVGGAAALLVLSVLPLPMNLIGQEYAPNEDDGQFTINTEMPPGTSLDGNDAAMAVIEQALHEIPEVDAFTTTVGQAGSRFGGSDRNGQIVVQLVEKVNRQRSVFQVMQDVRRVQARIPSMQVRAQVQSPLIGGGGSVPINLRLLGDNIKTLEQLAEQVETMVRNTPGTVDIRNDASLGEPEVRAFLDRRKLADLGVTATQVATALRTAIGGTTVTQLRVEGQLGIDITVLADRIQRNDLTAIANIPIPLGGVGAGANSSVPVSGSTIRLGQVADLRLVTGPTTIFRSDRQRQ